MKVALEKGYKTELIKFGRDQKFTPRFDSSS